MKYEKEMRMIYSMDKLDFKNNVIIIIYLFIHFIIYFSFLNLLLINVLIYLHMLKIHI